MTNSTVTKPEIGFTEEITQAIARNNSIQVRGLQITLNDDEMTITGRCTTYYQKQGVGHVAMQYRGNRSFLIKNDIEVT